MNSFDFVTFAGIVADGPPEALGPGQARDGFGYRLGRTGPDGSRTMLPPYGRTRVFNTSAQVYGGAPSSGFGVYLLAGTDFGLRTGESAVVVVDHNNSGAIVGVDVLPEMTFEERAGLNVT